MVKRNDDFYTEDLSKIVEQDYNGDIVKFSSDMIKKFDNELKYIRKNSNKLTSNNEQQFFEREEEIISVQEEGNSYSEKKNVLSKKIEERILREIEIIKKLPNTKLYSKEEAFSLIFGEDYINEELPN